MQKIGYYGNVIFQNKIDLMKKGKINKYVTLD